MPVYIYRCDSCGVHFDRWQKYTDAPLTRCPECDKKSLHKVYAPVGIVFKGSGFYSTDHKSPSGQTPQAKKNDEGKEKKGESKESQDESKEYKGESKEYKGESKEYKGESKESKNNEKAEQHPSENVKI